MQTGKHGEQQAHKSNARGDESPQGNPAMRGVPGAMVILLVEHVTRRTDGATRAARRAPHQEERLQSRQGGHGGVPYIKSMIVHVIIIGWPLLIAPARVQRPETGDQRLNRTGSAKLWLLIDVAFVLAASIK